MLLAMVFVDEEELLLIDTLEQLILESRVYRERRLRSQVCV